MARDDIGTVAAQEAEAIENADSPEEAQLIGDSVLDVRASINVDGQLRDIEVSYNASHAKITVNVTRGTLTASAGFDTHKVHVNDDDGVLSAVDAFWGAQFDGVEVSD